MHIHYERFHLPKMLIGFGLLDKSLFVSLHTFEALICKERIPIPACGLSDVILREPVDEIDIRPQQILNARHLLDDEIPVMYHELQIKRGNGLARPARTSCPAV